MKPRFINGCCKSVYIAEAFEARGWDAWTCDILPSEGAKAQADIEVEEQGMTDKQEIYTLNCDNCRAFFESAVAFPTRQLCPKCFGQEELLLTDEELIKISDCYVGLPMAAQIATSKAQLALDLQHEQATVEEIFNDLEDMELLKNHNHRKGINKLIACPRCSYNEFKSKYQKQEGK